MHTPTHHQRRGANDFGRNGFCLFFFVCFFSLVNFLFSISGRQEPRLVPSGQTPGSVRQRQIVELSANQCGGWVVAEATADLGRRVLEMWGLFCCLSPASRSESSKEELVEEAPGKDLRGPRGPTAQHCSTGQPITVLLFLAIGQFW